MNRLLLVSGIVAVVAVFCACGGPPAPPRPAAELIRAVTAGELRDAYRANEAAADRDYLGRWLRVTGTVDRVSTSGSSVYLHLDAGVLSGVRCEVEGASKSAAASLARGDAVIVTGVCRGKLFDPYLDTCEFARR